MKKVSFLIAVGFLAGGSVFTSCTKDSTTTPITSSEVANAQDNAIASIAFDNIDAQVAALSSGSLKADAVEDTTEKPEHKIKEFKKGKITHELTFNDINQDGKIKHGKIIVDITYPTTGDTTDEKQWVKTIKLENYSDGGRKLEGTKTITYLGLVNGFPTWNVKLDSGKVTLKNGKVITFQYDRTRAMIEGFTTPLNHSDDVFEINGTGSGINRKGVAFTSVFTNLIKVAGCPTFKSGTVTYTTETKTSTITFNGGDTCSPTATVTVDGKVKTIDTDIEAN